MRLHVNGKDIEKQKIYIGFEGEKNYTEIEFDFSDVFSEYPEANAYMNIKPYKGEIYPHTLTREGTNLLVWNVNEADCTVPGVGMYQITFTYNNTVIKSFKGICVVRDSIIGSADPPTPVEEWIADASAALAALENITASAENLPEGSDATAEIRTVNGHKDIHIGVPAGEKGDQGFSPVVTVTDVPGGHQVVIRDESGEYTFTVMNGEDGDDGVSPQITVTNITGGHRVSVTDASGTDTFDVMDGLDGQDGVTPDFSIGTVQTLPAGSDATASVTGTAENPVLNLGIPQGAKGDPGEIPQETLDQIEQDISDLNSALEEKADVIVSSASGAIASFPDGAESTAKELVVSIEPVQDLHGQDAPYPPGGMANKWDEVWEVGGIGSDGQNSAGNSTIRSKNYIPVSAETSYYYYNGAGITAGLRFYDSTKTHIGNATGVANRDFTTPSNAAYMRFVVLADYGTTYNNNIAINYPSTVTSYTPYSNICPISGWTGANVSRTGKNLFPDAGDVIAVASKQFRYDNPIILKGQTVTLSASDIAFGSGYTSSVVFLLKENGAINNLSFTTTTKSRTWTATEDVYGLNFYATSSGSTNPGVTTTYYNFQIELGSSATEFSAYQGQSLSISFPSEAGTVYGGNLTVYEDGSGKLVVDRATDIVDGTQSLNGNGNLSYGGIQVIYTPSADKKRGTSRLNQNIGLLSDRFCTTDPGPFNAYCITGRATNGNVYINMPADVTTAVQARAWFSENNTQISYLLATPIEYTISNLEVLELLKGVNNVWADCGNTSVTYRADTKLYIDNKITQAIANALNS